MGSTECSNQVVRKHMWLCVCASSMEGYDKSWPCLFPILFHSTKESRMHGVLNEVYLQNFFRDGCNFSR